LFASTIERDCTDCVPAGHGAIRLVNVPGGPLCQGRLEVFFSTDEVRAWFAVCDENFGADEVRVTCRQLGCPYGAAHRTDVARYSFLVLLWY